MDTLNTVIENSATYVFNTYRFKYVVTGDFDDDIDFIIHEGEGNYAFAKPFGIKDINLRWTCKGVLPTFEICFNDIGIFLENLKIWKQTLLGKITNQYLVERKLVEFEKIESRLYSISETPIIQTNPEHLYRFTLKREWVLRRKNEINEFVNAHTDIIFPSKTFSGWLNGESKNEPSVFYFDIDDIECSTLLIFMFPSESIQRIQHIIKRDS